LGYLWLAKAHERMRELFRAAYKLDEDKNNI
jgi:23S rRNA maturation mini-RNase III